MIKKIILLSFAIFFIALFFIYDFSQFLTLAKLKEHHQTLALLIEKHPLMYGLCFSLIYVFTVAFSIPGATLLSILGGALFGHFYGLVIVSLSSTLGATLAFLGSRWWLTNSVQTRWGDQLLMLQRGLKEKGLYYLFLLRLTPAVPAALINLVMGLTPMSPIAFFIVSLLGILPITFIYVNAGSQLTTLQSYSDILSWPLMLSLAAIGAFPLWAQWFYEKFLQRKFYSKP